MARSSPIENSELERIHCKRTQSHSMLFFSTTQILPVNQYDLRGFVWIAKVALIELHGHGWWAPNHHHRTTTENGRTMEERCNFVRRINIYVILMLSRSGRATKQHVKNDDVWWTGAKHCWKPQLNRIIGFKGEAEDGLRRRQRKLKYRCLHFSAAPAVSRHENSLSDVTAEITAPQMKIWIVRDVEICHSCTVLACISAHSRRRPYAIGSSALNMQSYRCFDFSHSILCHVLMFLKALTRTEQSIHPQPHQITAASTRIYL